jgi:hypothetical protein
MQEDPMAVTDQADYAEIADLLSRYGHALDGKDWDLLRSCFLPDSSFEYADSGSFITYADFEDFARTTLARCRSTQHLIGSVRILTDGDTGTSHSYAQAAHIMTSGELRLTGTSYYDTLRRTGDGWRVAARRMVRLWGQGPQSRSDGADERLLASRRRNSAAKVIAQTALSRPASGL